MSPWPKLDSVMGGSPRPFGGPVNADRERSALGRKRPSAPADKSDAGVRHSEADHPNVNNGWKPALQSGIVPG